jgi:hypothetical protein
MDIQSSEQRTQRGEGNKTTSVQTSVEERISPALVQTTTSVQTRGASTSTTVTAAAVATRTSVEQRGEAVTVEDSPLITSRQVAAPHTVSSTQKPSVDESITLQDWSARVTFTLKLS